MRIVRTVLAALAAVVVLAVLAATAVVVRGRSLLLAPVREPLPTLRVAPDSALAERGAHLASVLCAACHAHDDPAVLSGGRENFVAIPGGPTFGVLFAPNLTPGGPLAQRSDPELARAIRGGVGHDGRPLLVMPSASLRNLSDRDLAALIAHLRRQPAVAHAVPARAMNPLGYAVLGLNLFPTSRQPPVDGPVADVPAAPDTAYGAYTLAIHDCVTCHGPDLRGGRQGQFPPVGPDLVAFAKAQPLPVFSAALRQGVNPRGGALDPARMPWPMYANLDDTETEAIWLALRGRP